MKRSLAVASMLGLGLTLHGLALHHSSTSKPGQSPPPGFQVRSGEGLFVPVTSSFAEKLDSRYEGFTPHQLDSSLEALRSDFKWMTDSIFQSKFLAGDFKQWALADTEDIENIQITAMDATPIAALPELVRTEVFSQGDARHTLALAYIEREHYPAIWDLAVEIRYVRRMGEALRPNPPAPGHLTSMVDGW